MNRAEVKRLAKARYGKDVEVEERKHALDPETRAIVKKEFEAHKAREPKPPPEVIAYNRRHAEWRRQLGELRGKLLLGRRYRIGVRWGIGFHVKGEGDTWEEAAREAKLLDEVAKESETVSE